MTTTPTERTLDDILAELWEVIEELKELLNVSAEKERGQ